MKTTETVWIIINPIFGAYVDFRFTRRDMVAKHCYEAGLTWEQARKRGDRVVKASLIY